MNSVKSSVKALKESCESNSIMCWVVRVVLLLYAGLVASNLPENIASLTNNVVVRLVMVLLVLGLSLYDPPSAILLAVAVVVTIQTSNKYHIANVGTSAINMASETQQQQQQQQVALQQQQVAQQQQQIAQQQQAAQQQQQQQQQGGYHQQQQGGYHQQGMNGAEHFTNMQQQNQPPDCEEDVSLGHEFTNATQLTNAQTNQVREDNQETEIRTWQNELGPQGLSQPSGYNVGPQTGLPFSGSCLVENC